PKNQSKPELWESGCDLSAEVPALSLEVADRKRFKMESGAGRQPPGAAANAGGVKNLLENLLESWGPSARQAGGAAAEGSPAAGSAGSATRSAAGFAGVGLRLRFGLGLRFGGPILGTADLADDRRAAFDLDLVGNLAPVNLDFAWKL